MGSLLIITPLKFKSQYRYKYLTSIMSLTPFDNYQLTE
ncbi:hypothetical protein LEP1GSC058_1074 [Leptospira fainei serovar Hurstbridge str. BUT 6]|uniref:Uncharacterized protein n=1 Tax=Leptospira fainei serovar Hurstbridge str. BUT 6 TaxID=1193011 RepID=S3UQH3_9LEPT|nr:hypothetical protein LEP1GSC058_1074 [Leptospira fainei serovar Hurstbridge str. BUT 6]